MTETPTTTDPNAVAPAVANLETIVSLSKRRGFVYPSSEIYGGINAVWDYGPLGVELKNNVKRAWWKAMVQGREDVVGLDSSVILPRQVWVASGHVGAFTDPLTECLSCHKRFREDQMLEEFEEKKGRPAENGLGDIACPSCGTRGQWTEPRDFNMMLKTYLGPVEDESGLHYLRPETAQGIFVNFANVVQTSRKKPPFGIGQVGKSFRNEITPGNFIFRTREFEQMEMEFFVEPGTDEEWHQYWMKERMAWYTGLGIREENLRFFEHPQEKLSHYSKGTTDIEYRFGFQGSEWGELEGIANRTDFDLSTHAKASGTDLSYFNQATNERYTPYVIEPAAGLTRSFMAFLIDAYTEDEAPNAKGGVDVRTVLKLDPRLAPVKAAVLPLSRNEALSPKAKDLGAQLRKNWNIDFDDAGAIGRRYRRQDEIGTPYCVTVDFDSLEDSAVTVRERDAISARGRVDRETDRERPRKAAREVHLLDDALVVGLAHEALERRERARSDHVEVGELPRGEDNHLERAEILGCVARPVDERAAVWRDQTVGRDRRHAVTWAAMRPSSSRAARVRVIDGGWTCSWSARSRGVSGPCRSSVASAAVCVRVRSWSARSVRNRRLSRITETRIVLASSAVRVIVGMTLRLPRYRYFR